jgi:hypothetical protein
VVGAATTLLAAAAETAAGGSLVMDSLGFLMPVTYFLGILRGVILRCADAGKTLIAVSLRNGEL